MSKKGRITVKHLLILIPVIIALVFFTKCAVNYIRGAFGTVSEKQAAEFLQSYGWKIENEALSVTEVTIPKEFSEVYERYNAIQKKQGYDLTKYCGETVTQFTFKVKNFGDYDNAEGHVLTWGGRIIGGDICSTQLNGIMTGFDGKTS